MPERSHLVTEGREATERQVNDWLMQGTRASLFSQLHVISSSRSFQRNTQKLSLLCPVLSFPYCLTSLPENTLSLHNLHKHPISDPTSRKLYLRYLLKSLPLWNLCSFVSCSNEWYFIFLIYEGILYFNTRAIIKAWHQVQVNRF